MTFERRFTIDVYCQRYGIFREAQLARKALEVAGWRFSHFNANKIEHWVREIRGAKIEATIDTFMEIHNVVELPGMGGDERMAIDFMEVPAS